MAQKQNLLKSFHKFLQTNFNVFMPSSPNLHKQRKYEHVEIQKQFETVEKQRKKQRLSLMEYNKKLKKQLLQQQIQHIKNTGSTPDQIDFQKAEKLDHFGQFRSYEEFMQHLIKNQEKIIFADESKQIEAENQVKYEQVQDPKQLLELEKQLDKVNNELEEITKTKQEIMQVEEQIEELEPGHVIISGMQKKIILNQIAYYEFQSRNLQGCVIHPETMKAIETIHYHVEHNLPVRRELLYEVMPELFEAEIDQLPKIEQEKIYANRIRLDSNETSLIRAVEKDWKPKTEKLDYFEKLKAQEYEMMDLIYKRAIEVATKHQDQIFTKLDAGFQNIDYVLENVEAKTEAQKNITEEEKALYDDIQELKQMNIDYMELVKMNRVRVAKKQRELHMPAFVENHPKLKEVWTEKWENIVKNSFDFSESIFVPVSDKSNESKLDEILNQQKKVDIQELIQKSKEEYQRQIEGDSPIRGRDRVNKDAGLVNKLNVLAEAMNQMPEEETQKKIPQFRGPIGNLQAPEEQRILITELPKLLYLNNMDPKHYNLQFWAEHFNIEPQKLRNIFNYISYAIPDVTNEKETGRVFRFIYDIENS